MSRIDQSRYNTKPKHEDVQIRLINLIVQFEMTIKFGEMPCYALRRLMIDEIQVDRKEIEQCTSSLDDLIMHNQSSIADQRWPDHMALITWMTDMSLACNLVNMGHNPMVTENIANARKRLVDLAFLTQGARLVQELDNCRVDRLNTFHR